MKFKRFAAMTLITTMVVSGCGSGAATEQVEPATAVEVASPINTTIKNEITYAGQVTPERSVAVTSKMTGKVKETFFDIGDHVNEGDVLFTLDEEDINNQIRTLNAQLAQANSGVSSAQNAAQSVTGGQYESQLSQQEGQIESSTKQLETAQVTIDNAKIAVDGATLALENATTTFNSTEALYSSGVVSKSEYDMAKAAYDNAVLGLDQANNALEQAELAYSQAEDHLQQAETNYGLTTGQITQENQQSAQLGVNSAQATANIISVQLDIAYEALEDTAVRAPMTGVISAKTAKAGEYTSPQMPAYTIIDASNIYVNVKVSELIINSLKVGDQIDVYIQSVSDEPIKGTIKTVSPAADQTGTYPVQIQIPNTSGEIKSGMFCEVHFIKDEKANALVLPIDAVLENDVEKYVYVVENNVAVKKIVTTGISNGKDIEILSGLSKEDQVIIKGQSYISDGEAINVVASDAVDAKEE